MEDYKVLVLVVASDHLLPLGSDLLRLGLELEEHIEVSRPEREQSRNTVIDISFKR
jgi:hypothetical protein